MTIVFWFISAAFWTGQTLAYFQSLGMVLVSCDRVKIVVSIGAMSVANSLRMRWLMESDPAAGVRPSIVFTFKFV